MPKAQTILITGSQGQVGQSFMRLADQCPHYSMVFVDRTKLDLCQHEQVRQYFQHNQFDLIINCAAYTAVDKAESDTASADAINHLAVKQLATIAKEQNVKLIHISTDYVFNGQQYRPYIETDPVDPQSVYGVTKLAAEQAIMQTMENNALIVRTSWVYSPTGSNFVKTMLKLGAERDSLAVIYDQIGTPTYANDLAQAIMTVAQSEEFNKAIFTTEIYHYSNEGVCSWYDFAKAIFGESGLSCQVTPIETKDYPTAAKRPAYSVLNKSKIKQTFNLTIPYWRESLKMCLAEL
ncbi:MAG: dTDP-4-dehydrorhamnose reductase [Cycloclasticus sp.]|nr:dTDP-4-dehydrorhamnose reductase [Cycloclasticus sp.]MBQ0790083.1 dTDP-4-dehydrorhamnose reductase [Cycloclasticus sp.]